MREAASIAQGELAQAGTDDFFLPLDVDLRAVGAGTIAARP